MSRCMDGGPIDPPDGPDERPCRECNGSGSTCDWCALPLASGPEAAELESPRPLCSCPPDGEGDDEWARRGEECHRCFGLGIDRAD